MSFLRKLLGGRSDQADQERQAVLDRIEREVAAEQSGEGDESSPDDRFELLAANFEDDQYAEYQAHGQQVSDALIMLHEGQAKEARALLETVMEHADGPRYLLFELGRARLLDGDLDRAEQAFEAFLAKLQHDEGGEARLAAHLDLAALRSDRGDFDAATEQYEAALEARPDDPRPYLAMAFFFRNQQLWDEAIEVLDAGLQVVGEHGPKWRLWIEQGLAHAGAGRDEPARALLGRALNHLVAHRERDLPAEAAVRLAQLHEKAGEPARALALLLLLCEGSDEANWFAYHVEAARLMTAQGQRSDARRMLERALELAPEDEPTRAAITQKLAEL